MNDEQKYPGYPWRGSKPWGNSRDYEVYKPPSFWQTAGFLQKVTLLVGIAYVLSPIDFIPEAVLGPLGLLDDGGAVVVVVATVKSVLAAREEIRRRQELGRDYR